MTKGIEAGWAPVATQPELERAEALGEGQRRILELVATGAPLDQVLTSLACLMESHSPGMLASVLLLDADGVHIRHGVAPSLPEAYLSAVDGAAIGPQAGSCGTAMYTRRPVIVTDIAEDPLWQDYRELAAAHGLRACWSIPILSRHGTVLGSFAMYYREPRAPEAGEQGAAEMACHLAGIAIERQRAADALRASEETYRTFFEDHPAGSYIAAPDGKLRACNPAYARLFGFESVAEALESSLWSRHPSALRIEAFLGLLRGHGQVQSYAHELPRKDGSALWVAETAMGRFDERGRLSEIHGYVIDETERRAAESQLRQVQKIEAIGQLAGGVAHDFNNLVGVIIGYSDLLLRDASYAGRARVEQVKRAAERAADLTRQLLAFSRKQVLEPKVLDLNRVLADTEQMLRRLIGEHILLVTALDRALGPIRADPGQLEQVIVNLAVNARDAMPQGGRLIITTANVDIDEDYVRAHPGASVGAHVLLAVTDTGVGMDAETQARVFEPFFTTKEPGKGTGLGLSTVYGIVKQSEGHIAVDSDPGRGATFTVYLPRVEEAVPDLGSVPGEAEPVPGAGSETILILEDEESLRIVLREVLQAAGYEVLECESAEAALAAAVQADLQPIHLMLADLVMPRMSGRQVAERIQAVHPRMKILYMSGYSPDMLALQDYPGRSVDFMAKPFPASALLRRIREVLDRPLPRS